MGINMLSASLFSSRSKNCYIMKSTTRVYMLSGSTSWSLENIEKIEEEKRCKSELFSPIIFGKYEV